MPFGPHPIAVPPGVWRSVASESRVGFSVPFARHGTFTAHFERHAATLTVTESVAALEGIRLDLLRLHAGSSDLAPLTTLVDAARLVGEDLSRLAEAQREAERAAGDGRGVERVPTPT